MYITSADRNRFALFVVLVALALAATGCGASRAFGRARERGAHGRLGCGRRVLPARGPAGARAHRLQDCARARDDQRVARAPEPGAADRGARRARGGASRIPPRERVRSAEPPARRQGDGDGAADPRAGRGAAPQQHRAAPRAGAAGRAAAAHQDQRGPAGDPLQQHEPARHPELHREGDRHQRHLRPRLPGPRVHGAA